MIKKIKLKHIYIVSFSYLIVITWTIKNYYKETWLREHGKISVIQREKAIRNGKKMNFYNYFFLTTKAERIFVAKEMNSKDMGNKELLKREVLYSIKDPNYFLIKGRQINFLVVFLLFPAIISLFLNSAISVVLQLKNRNNTLFNSINFILMSFMRVLAFKSLLILPFI